MLYFLNQYPQDPEPCPTKDEMVHQKGPTFDDNVKVKQPPIQVNSLLLKIKVRTEKIVNLQSKKAILLQTLFVLKT